MLNNYTALKRPRRDDDYAPGGVSGGRPNRALIVYCNMIRRVFGGSVGILAGGIEASLRRFAHYDFWDDAVRRPILLDAPADGLVYGMGELPLQEIAQAMRSRAARGACNSTQSDNLAALVRAVRGLVYRTPASQPAPAGCHRLPSFEDVRSNPEAQVRAFREEMKFRATGACQDCAGHRVVANPPSRPLTTAEMDSLYSLSFRREEHPSRLQFDPAHGGHQPRSPSPDAGRHGEGIDRERVPALEQVRFSITSHRGCFGGCAFCGIYTHQGKAVQSRSRESVLREVKEIVRHPGFDGTIRDIGGPSANMWMMSCRHGSPCARPSCLAPRLCKDLNADGTRYLELLSAARKTQGVKHLFVTTGVRMDLALACDPFVAEFAEHYTSGHAKVAPEHLVPEILRLMLKPEGEVFLRFLEKFRRASAKAGKEQYLLPYIIAAHPGSKLEDMVEVALCLKRERLRVEQCQIFIPLPGTASAVMYATGINPFDGKRVFVEREPRRREMQKALVLYHLPESRKLVLEALEICGRLNLERVLLPLRAARRTPLPLSRHGRSRPVAGQPRRLRRQ